VSARASQLRIGAFVVGGLAILAAALFFFGIRSAFDPTVTMETYAVGDVEGLSIGSAVKLRGVTVGRVTDIGFSWKLYRDASPRCVVVRFVVKEAYSPVPTGRDLAPELERAVASGFRAVVQSEGITGSSIVALQTLDPKLYPPLAVPWKPRYPYIPSAPSQFGQILASLDRTLGNLSKLDLARIAASADRALGSVEAAARKVGELDMASVSGNVNRIGSDTRAAVQEYQGLAKDARRTLQAMKLEEVGAGTHRLVNKLDVEIEALVGELRVVVVKLNGIDVPALNDTLAGTREAARNLNEALESLRAHPSGFLFGGKPAPVSALAKDDK